MVFLIFCAFFAFLTFPHFPFFGGYKKRVAKLKDKLEALQQTKVPFYSIKTLKKEKYTYEDNFLVIEMTKKDRRFDIRTYFKDFIKERTIAIHMLYDTEQKKWIKDAIYEKNIKDFLGTDNQVDSVIQSLKTFVHNESLSLFSVENEHQHVSSSSTINDSNVILPSSLLSELHQHLLSGNFNWTNNENIESYETVDGIWEIKIAKKEDGIHRISIYKDNDYVSVINYTPTTKLIHSLDINKNVMHELTDTSSFVHSLQQILFYCYERTSQYEQKLSTIMKQFNENPFSFIEQTETVTQKINFIENNIDLLNVEEAHLFLSIKEKKFPELLILKEKISYDSSYQDDLLKLIKILSDSLDKLKNKIDDTHGKSIQLNEKLIEKLEED